MNLLSELTRKIENKQIRVVVAGCGYVGIPVAALFAKAGFEVAGLDIDEEKIRTLQAGKNPIKGIEPGLSELIEEVTNYCSSSIENHPVSPLDLSSPNSSLPSRRINHQDFSTEAVAAGDLSSRKITTLGRVTWSTNSWHYRRADIVIIAVETPIDSDDRKPKYQALKSVLDAICQNAATGPAPEQARCGARPLMVIVESTVAPLTADKLVRPMLEQNTNKYEGRDLFVISCPERVMPGLLLDRLEHCNRLIGASSPEVAETAKLLYRNILKQDPSRDRFNQGEIDITTNLQAEITKTAENTFRDVQIGFANELARICEHYGADFYEVRELINKCPDRYVHLPGPGVGGHCLPKDSWLLLSNLDKTEQNSIIANARYLNDSQPRHIFKISARALIETKTPPSKAKVAILGYAFKADSDDERDTPVMYFLPHLNKHRIQYKIFDPYIERFAHYPRTTNFGLSGKLKFATPEDKRRADFSLLGGTEVPPPILGKVPPPPKTGGQTLVCPDRTKVLSPGNVDALQDILSWANIAIVMTGHSQFKPLLPALDKLLQPPKILIDTANIFSPKDVANTALYYRSVGR